MKRMTRIVKRDVFRFSLARFFSFKRYNITYYKRKFILLFSHYHFISTINYKYSLNYMQWKLWKFISRHLGLIRLKRYYFSCSKLIQHCSIWNSFVEAVHLVSNFYLLLNAYIVGRMNFIGIYFRECSNQVFCCIYILTKESVILVSV